MSTNTDTGDLRAAPAAGGSSEAYNRHPSRLLRFGGAVLVGAVLAVAFLAYLSPDMQLQWENLMALCGF